MASTSPLASAPPTSASITGNSGQNWVVVAVGLGFVLLTWGLYFLVFSGEELDMTSPAFGLSVAGLSFTLGIRHAFDADHIAAIDNASRKLVGEGKQAGAVGLWFALGHSTVVLTSVIVLSLGLGALLGQIGDEDSTLARVTGIWGPTVSGIFLLFIAGVNMIALVTVLSKSKDTGVGGPKPAHVFAPVSAVLAKLGTALDKPWKMFIVGTLFGLGFDTASSIALIVLAGGATLSIPWYAAIVFPLLFASGMVAADSLNSLTMSRAYIWSIANPRRLRSYNLVLIGISISVAALVGVVSLASVLADNFDVAAPITWLAELNLDYFGFIILGIMLTLWLLSAVHQKTGEQWGSVSRKSSEIHRKM